MKQDKKIENLENENCVFSEIDFETALNQYFDTWELGVRLDASNHIDLLSISNQYKSVISKALKNDTYIGE